MEESVALDTSKQKQFVKSIRGIKNLIKKKDEEPGSLLRIKKNDFSKKRKKRGLVYLSHIPHGFYENEMTQYFKQFGVVTNARVIRSRRTGNSKGFAFVEFKDTSVAEIVAETMNNYLMGKRLIKATYIPPEKQRPNALRKNWNSSANPTNEYRMKMKNAYNQDKDEKGDLQRARKIVSNLLKTKKRLSEMGINYDFFTPVDVPEELVERVAVKHKLDDSKDDIKTEEVPSKKTKKAKKVKEEIKVEKKPVKAEAKSKKPKEEEKKEVEKKKEAVANKKMKGAEKEVVAVNQKQKQEDLKAKGVIPIEEFIKLSDDEGSDSSAEFDSDEYEKMLRQDDSNISGDDDDSNEDSDDELDDDESEAESIIDIPILKKKGKPALKVQPPLKQQQKKAKPEVAKKVPEQKKGPQKSPVPAKKPKFEKQIKKKPINKQFKKKK